MLDWEGLIKRYVWDDQTTPYLVPVTRLNRQQADSEVLAYSLFMGVLFAVIALSSLSEASPYGRSPLTAVYGFTVVSACLLLNYTKMQPAAWYLALTPLVSLAFLALAGANSGRDPFDTALVASILLLLLWYSVRLVRLVRRYPDLPQADKPPPRRRLFK